MSKNIELTASDDVKSFNYCTQLINIHGFNWIRGLDDLTNAISHTSTSAMLLKQFVDEATSLEELREKAKNLKAEIDRLHNYVWDFKENEDRNFRRGRPHGAHVVLPRRQRRPRGRVQGGHRRGI